MLKVYCCREGDYMKVAMLPSHDAFLTRREFRLLCRRLTAQGIQVAIFFFSRSESHIPIGLEFKRYPLSLEFGPSRYPLPEPFSLLRAARDVLKYGPDVVHVWDYEFLPAIAAIYLKILAPGLPLVVSADSFPGLSWSSDDPLIDALASVYTASIGRFLASLCDAFVVYSDSFVRDAIRMGVNESKIHVIPLGVDIRKFRPDLPVAAIRESLGLRPDDVVLLFVGRLVPIKRISLLLKVFKRVARERDDVKLLIVGDGPLKSLILEAMKEDSRILYLGPREDVNMIMAASDVLILPSRSEGVPSVILEAQACGMPVIASRTGGIPDVVKHGRTGLLVDVNDLHGLIRALRRLINNPELRRTMGQEARRLIKERDFSIENFVAKYIKLYREISK